MDQKYILTKSRDVRVYIRAEETDARCTLRNYFVAPIWPVNPEATCDKKVCVVVGSNRKEK